MPLSFSSGPARGRSCHAAVGAGLIVLGMVLAVVRIGFAEGGGWTLPWVLLVAGTAWCGRWRADVVVVGTAVGCEGLLAVRAAPATGFLLGEFLSLAGVLIVVAIAVTNWRRAGLLARELARLDELTGLLNRRGFREAVTAELGRSRRTARGFAVVFLDGDRFKAINDALGHRAGDEALREVAAMLRAQTRSYDAVARLGGDEFGLLLPETTATSAVDIVRRLQAAVAAGRFGLTLSAGVVWTAGAAEESEDLLDRADREMRAAKKEGDGAIRSGILPHGASGPASENPC